MEKQKYITIGTKTITKELFRNVLRPLNNYDFLPTGGFWASPYSFCNISQWFDYLIDNRDAYPDKNICDASIFTLKDSAKILTIDNYETVKEIIKKYPSYHHLLNFYCEPTQEKLSFNYELLSKNYDGIYVNYENFVFNKNTRIFDKWDVNTLLLFNLDAIDKSTSAHIKYHLPNSLFYYSLVEEQEYSIEKESIYHKEIVLFIQELFNNLAKQKNLFNDYDEYFRYLIECTKKCIEIGIIDKEKEANKIRELLKEKNIETTNYIIIRNICANTLSNYLRDNVSIEEKLPKTRVKKCSKYSIE